MNDLFRQEALDYHARAVHPDSTLDVPRWSTLFYWALLVAVAAALAAALLIRVDGARLLGVLIGGGR